MRFEKYLKKSNQSAAGTNTNWIFIGVLVVVTGLFLVWVQQVMQSTAVESVYVDVQQEDETEEVSSTPVEESDVESPADLPLREFVDREVGISFLYPIETGGVVSFFDEFGCFESQTQCYVRHYTIQDPRSGRRSTFAAIMTEAYKQEPLARGFQWTDQLLLLSDNWRQVCERDASCEVRQNRVDHTYYRFNQFPQAEFARFDNDIVSSVPSFVFPVPHRTYAQVIISENELDWLPRQQKNDFISSIISSFDFFE